MSEYQSEHEHAQPNNTNKSFHYDFNPFLEIADNRSQSASQRTAQKKLSQFKQLQSANILQREGGSKEVKLPVQGKSMSNPKTENPDEEEPTQDKPDAGVAVSQQKAAISKSNTTGLPDNLKSGIETLSGLSLDNVQVHYNSEKPTQLQALAYTQGTDIHVAPGQERHLPHEAWHVVQQMQGRVQPTIEINDGIQVNDNAGLESEADVMGQKAL